MAGAVGPEAVKPIDSEKWHLAHALHPVTLCGELIHYGSRRRLWQDTPRDDRCHLCLQVLGV
jgi:hypothetical protein